MKRLASLLALALALVPTACEPSTPVATTAMPACERTSVDAPKLPPPSPAGLAALAKSNNAFGLDVYGKIRSQPGNLAFAPVSLTTALAMTWAGARGETAAQMKKVLHAEGTPDQTADAAARFVASFRGPDKKVTLRVANRLFGEQTYPFDPAFVGRQKAAFGAPFETVDFKRDSEGGRKRINDWVLGETENRIKDLIPRGGVDGDTRLVLTNAIYFLGDWLMPFEKAQTRSEAFYPSANDTKMVPTMHQIAHLRFAAVDGVKLLELPYQGGELSMTLVLPDAADGLPAVESRLSPAKLDAWIGAMSGQQVDVALPKFEIDPQGSFSLRDTLEALGMPIAFDDARADFSGMIDPAKRADRLFIARVFHKAFVKVDEKGTEAAAASGVVMSAESGVMAPKAAFRADHPFLFFLRDARSNTILFMGRVADPSAK